MRYKLNSDLEMDTVAGELVVLNPARVSFFYYSPPTEKFLKIFEKPSSVEDLVEFGVVPQEEVPTLNEFMTHLVVTGILLPEPDAKRSERPEYAYERPLFNSDKKQRVDDFAYLNPVGSSGH